MDGWNTTFLLGRPIFRGHVSFRECIIGFWVHLVWILTKPTNPLNSDHAAWSVFFLDQQAAWAMVSGQISLLYLNKPTKNSQMEGKWEFGLFQGNLGKW